MKKSEYIILLLIVCALIYHYKLSKNKIEIINPQPNIVVPIVPDDPDPIIKNDYEIALDKASKSDKVLLVIFTADWCGYCRSLKKDMASIIDSKKYDIYIVDIDNESSQSLRERFDIKMVPCSIMINPKNDTEMGQICGYIPDKYKRWLKE